MSGQFKHSLVASALCAVIFISLLIFTVGYLAEKQIWIHQGWTIFFYGFSALITYDAINRAVEKFGSNRWRWVLLAFALFVLGALAFSGSAQAETGNISSTNAPMKEWIDTGASSANTLLCATVGDIGGTGLFGKCKKNDGVANLQAAIKTFNIAVFSVAALFMLWNLLSGTMSSAHDGEFLGKRNHSSWAPLRLVIGGAMLVPAFGGFNLAQLVMVWATAVGVGIAGAAASGAVATMGSLASPYTVPSNLIKGADVMKAASAPIGCVSGWTHINKRWIEEGVTDPALKELKWDMTVATVASSTGAQSLRLSFGETSGAAGYGEAYCGIATFPLPDTGSTSVGAAAMQSAVASSMTSGIPVLARAMLAEYILVDSASAMSDAEIAASRARVQAAVAAFDTSMAVAVKAAVAMANMVTANTTVAKSDWIGLGFGDVRSAVDGIGLAKKVGSAPATTAAVSTAPDRGSRSPGCSTNSTGETYCVEGGQKLATERISDAAGDVVAAAKGAINFVTDFDASMNHAVGELGKMVASSLESTVASDGGSPMPALIQLGVSISGWMAALILTFLAAAAALSLVSLTIPAAGGLITIIGFILMAITIPLMFFGLKLAAYLPFLIAIVWCGAVLNWLVVVFESLFGAPLWAMAHLDMEGEGISTQRTAHGYYFLLNLLFRPTLLVVAFLFAKLLMDAIFGLFLGGVSGMLGALETSSSSWWGNLMMIIGALWVIVAFAEQVITTSMSILFSAPDRIIQFVGQNLMSSGTGADIEQGVGGRTKGMADATGRGAGEGAALVMKSAGEMVKKPKKPTNAITTPFYKKVSGEGSPYGD